MFWAPTYQFTHIGFWVCKRKVDNESQNSEKPVFLKPSFESCTKQQCSMMLGILFNEPKNLHVSWLKHVAFAKLLPIIFKLFFGI